MFSIFGCLSTPSNHHSAGNLNGTRFHAVGTERQACPCRGTRSEESAMLVAPLTLSTLISPICTVSCNHKNFTSKCRILPRPLVATKDFATDESVEMRTIFNCGDKPVSVIPVCVPNPPCRTIVRRDELGFSTRCYHSWMPRRPRTADVFADLQHFSACGPLAVDTREVTQKEGTLA